LCVDVAVGQSCCGTEPESSPHRNGTGQRHQPHSTFSAACSAVSARHHHGDDGGENERDRRRPANRVDQRIGIGDDHDDLLDPVPQPAPWVPDQQVRQRAAVREHERTGQAAQEPKHARCDRQQASDPKAAPTTDAEQAEAHPHNRIEQPRRHRLADRFIQRRG
jgi:hypothetical protein